MYNIATIILEAGVRLSRWIFFPPFLSFFLLIATVALHREGNAADVPPILWGLVIAAYVCLCGLSTVYMTKRDTRYNAGIAFLAQGVLLPAISVQAGVVVFAWVGLIFFLIGLFCVFLYATHSYMDVPQTVMHENPDNDIDADRLLSQLGIPICYTDAKGVVEEATATFMEAVDRKPEEIIGEEITEVMPIDAPEVVLPSGTWWLEIVKSGPHHYFYLHPTKDGKPAKAPAQTQKKSNAADSFIDPETGLYSNEYRKLRGPEEVSRAQRYKRPLSGMLLELAFNASPNISLSEEQFTMLRKAFAVKVKEVLRTTDCGFWMDDHKQIQLLLPETPQAGAKTLLSRLLLLPQDVFDEDIRAAVNPKVRAGIYFYNGTSKQEYNSFSATLEHAFADAKDGAPGVGNAA